MYSETKKAGIRHCLTALIAAIVLSVISTAVKYFLPDVPLAGQLVTILFFGLLVYMVFVHYASTFEYKVGGHKIIITRTSGRRIKVIEIKSSQITQISEKRPDKIKTDRMTVEVFFPKNPLYISYGEKAVLIDAGRELCRHINNLTNGEVK